MTETFTYKITVPGTGIREYYEFTTCYSEDTVKSMWLNDVKDNHSVIVSDAVFDHAEVELLSDDPDDNPALPP